MTSSGFQPSTPPPQEVTMTLSPPVVLADGDAAVVAGDGQRDPAASAPVTFDFMGSPGIAGTAHDRRAARPPHPRKYWFGYGPAGDGPWPASGYHMVLCSSGGVSQLRPACATRDYHMQRAPSLFKKGPSERRRLGCPCCHLRLLLTSWPDLWPSSFLILIACFATLEGVRIKSVTPMHHPVSMGSSATSASGRRRA
jgi:hypothetical protein